MTHLRKNRAAALVVALCLLLTAGAVFAGRDLRTNTDTLVTIGPFYDKTTGVDIETGLTISNERITATADHGNGSITLILDNLTASTSGTANDLNYIAGNDAGLMQIELAAANVNYLGRFFLSITDAANHVPVWHEFNIISAAEYDRKYGSTIANVNVTHINGTTQTGRDLGASVLISSGTGTGQLAVTSGRIDANVTHVNGSATTATLNSVAASLTDIKGATFAGSTDSLEAIRDRGDAAWTTGNTTTPLSAQQTRDAMTLARTPGAPPTGSIDDSLSNIGVQITTVQAHLNGTLEAGAHLNSTAQAQAIEAVLAAAHGTGSWDASGAGGTGLTAQETRDAMKLAPTAGDPAAGSVDALLAAIPTNPATESTSGAIEAVAAAVQAVTDKLDTALEDNGAGVWRLNEAAQEYAIQHSSHAAHVSGLMQCGGWEQAHYAVINGTVPLDAVVWIGYNSVRPNSYKYIYKKNAGEAVLTNIYVAEGNAWPIPRRSTLFVYIKANTEAITPFYIDLRPEWMDASEYRQSVMIRVPAIPIGEHIDGYIGVNGDIIPSTNDGLNTVDWDFEAGGTGLSAQETRDALGMAAADLDSQLDTLAKETTVLNQFGVTYGTRYPLVERNGVIPVQRGDVLTISKTLTTDFPLTGRTVYFIAQAARATTNTTAIVNRAMTITDVSARTVTITLTAAETATAGQYMYEIEVRDTTTEANPATAEAGKLNIIDDLRK